MNNGILKMPAFKNAGTMGYVPDGQYKAEMEDTLRKMKDNCLEIPLIIGGKEVFTGKTKQCILPHEKNHSIGFYHIAGAKEAQMAIEAAMAAKKVWADMAYDERMRIFLHAAELAGTTYRSRLTAATMLCQSKNFSQADADAPAEMMDFYRMNCKVLCDMYAMQPISVEGSINKIDYRPLEGFIFAVTPFNFTAIASNLPTAPAIAGNTVVWKPASVAVYSAYMLMQLWKEAGLPAGVINFIPGSASAISDTVLKHPDLGGIHFTGSSEVFKGFYRQIGEHIYDYKTFPRIVGETGGKNFYMVHNSADVDQVVAAIIKGGFEYQGQKCSACSRVYLPASLWKVVQEKLIAEISTIKMGPADDFESYMTAVIDQTAFNSIEEHINYAKVSDEAEVICGGGCDDSIGFFIQPTVILTTNPKFRTMLEEIFGPVVTIYLYDDSAYEETLELCANSCRYSLTGSLFGKDRLALNVGERTLKYGCGNLYINSKSTGALVGQQPFGGGRASGTNDKAGTIINMLKWVSPLTTKETFNSERNYSFFE